MTLRDAHLTPVHKHDAVRHLERIRTSTATGAGVLDAHAAATR